jgi:hypothetical protein
MEFYNQIYDYISLPNISVVYLAIGSAMGAYNKITTENNQQYACFLDKFIGHKIIILIDPYLEEELKILKYCASINKPLIERQYIVDNEKPIFRKYENDECTVFAINRDFYFETNSYLSLQQNQQVDEDVSFIINTITQCLGKIKKTKFIIQDYTGYDATYFNINLFNIFEKQELLNNVMFDVTQKEGGCLIKLEPNLARVDESGNFYQEKFMKLIDIKRNDINTHSIYQERIDHINYIITYNYKNLYEKKKNFIPIEPRKIKYYSTVYSIEYDETNLNNDYQIDKHFDLAKRMINDIIIFKDFDRYMEHYLATNLANRNDFIKTTSQLKYVN